jgi:hypothetical protein
MLVHQRVESTARSGNFSWNNQAFFREDSANPVPIIYAVVAVTLLYFAQMNRIFPQETPWPRLLHPYRHCWKKKITTTINSLFTCCGLFTCFREIWQFGFSTHPKNIHCQPAYQTCFAESVVAATKLLEKSHVKCGSISLSMERIDIWKVLKPVTK